MALPSMASFFFLGGGFLGDFPPIQKEKTGTSGW